MTNMPDFLMGDIFTTTKWPDQTSSVRDCSISAPWLCLEATMKVTACLFVSEGMSHIKGTGGQGFCQHFDFHITKDNLGEKRKANLFFEERI